ncbi:hypothetical protein ZWY2020_055891 [Hordeum vulgare]|nr:hypothetical protein ZWY2020_055891 [Hordeum vulgare]
MNPYIAIYDIMEIFSQIPGLDSLWWLSTVATIMSLTYTTIRISLGVVQIKANEGLHGSLTGVAVGNNITVMQKVRHDLQAFRNMAFAYAFSIVLLEIQDTLNAAASSEAKVMKQATAVSVAVTTMIYLLCGCVGYAAFGNGVRINEPLWLLDVANAAVAVHLVGTYQVISQPIFDYVELRAAAAWPDNGFVCTRDVRLWPSDVHVAICPLRLIGRTAYVCLTTGVVMAMPFFGSVVGLIGVVSFWTLTVYFPVSMYIAQRQPAGTVGQARGGCSSRRSAPGACSSPSRPSSVGGNW